MVPPEQMVRSNSTLFPHHRYLRRSYWNSWYPEILALTFTLACIVSTAITLLVFNGKQAPSLRFGLTINTIISILGTGAKTSLLFAISNSLGQLKWVWYAGDSKPLLGAEKFDDATRGPLGALVFLFSHARSSIASIGALVTICALAFDPFMQQVIAVRATNVYQPSSEAVLHPSYHFNDLGAVANDAHALDRSLLVQKVASSALLGKPLLWPYSCPTGFCKWQDFHTLAWRADCKKPDSIWVTSPGCDLSFLSTNETLPDTYYPKCTISSTAHPAWKGLDIPLEVTVPSSNSSSDTAITVNGAATYLRTVVLNESAFLSPQSLWSEFRLNLTYDQQARTHLEASVCDFDLYLDTYDVEHGPTGMAMNLTRSEVLQRPPLESWMNITDDPILCLRPPLNSALDSSMSRSFYFCAPGILKFAEWPAYLFDVRIDQTFEFIRSSLDITNITRTSSKSSPQSKVAPVLLGLDFEDAMHNVAASLTSLGLDPTLVEPNVNTTLPFNGQMGTPTNIVTIRWPWLILPYLICLIGVLFLVATIYLSRKSSAPLWKSSIHALLYHGLDHDMDIHTPLATISDMDDQAATITARLSPVGAQQRLMLETTVLKRYKDDD